MAIRTRTVTGLVVHNDNTPWAAASVKVRLTRASFTTDADITTDWVTVTTSIAGVWSKALWCEDDGLLVAHYKVKLPDESWYEFDLPYGDGTSVSVDTLRALGVAAVDPSATTILEAVLVAHEGEANPHAVYLTPTEGAAAYDALGAAAAVAGNLTTHAGLTTTAHGGIVASTDARLTDARTPTAHTHVGTDIMERWTIEFTGAGDAYIPAEVAMTIDAGVAAIGTGTLAYAKSTTATPSVFGATTLPATLEAGAWLKVTASAITGFVALHLKRTA